MKLYNIYESIILEEKNILLTENDTLLIESNKEDIMDILKNKYETWFKYRDKKGGVTDRYVQIHQHGSSKKGKEMISAWQKGGKTAKTKTTSTDSGWKQFLVNNIVDGSITPNKMTFNKPISDIPSMASYKSQKNPRTGKTKNAYNTKGNDNMTGNIKSADFNE